jgi:membrane protein implicated in regulation of membrane protease activity
VSSLFLGCFTFGLLFTVVSALLGAFNGGHGVHFPGLHGHGDHGAHAGGHGHGQISPFNASTIAAFLAWFGGAGYLLTRYSGFTALSITAIASVAGLAGATLVFAFVAKFINPRLTVLAPEDFQVPGIVAKVTSTIRPGGTGEIVYTLGGTRHSDGARSETAELLERGTEVVILRVEKGIAYVDRWSKFAAMNELPSDDGAVK